MEQSSNDIGYQNNQTDTNQYLMPDLWTDNANFKQPTPEDIKETEDILSKQRFL